MSTHQFTPTHTAEHNGRIFIVDATAPLRLGRLLCRGTMDGEFRIFQKDLTKWRKLPTAPRARHDAVRAISA